MAAARSNPWPFSRRKTTKAKPARRSSMTVPQATTAAYKAGQGNGDTGAFDGWLQKQGLSVRSAGLKSKLRERFNQGVEDGEGGEYKGSRITVHGYQDVRVTGKEKTSHKFSSVDAAKHFLDFAQTNPTDRALRYRANATPPAPPKRCLFCGSWKTIEIGHIDGHEEHGEPENLIWTCRSCNTIAGNTLKKAKLGRKIRQFNPTKSGGAANIGEWVQALGAIVPHKGERYAGYRYGLTSTMSTGDAVAMIRATPAHKRSEFSAKLGKTKTGRARAAAEERWNPNSLIREAETSRNILELARLHKYARLNKNKPLLSAVEARAKDLGISHQDLLKNEPRQWNPSDPTRYWVTSRTTGRGHWEVRKVVMQDGKEADGGMHSEWPTKRQAKADAARLNAALKRVRRNPQSEADALYESFHGRPSTETIEITDEIHEHEHLATLGKLVEIFVETESSLLAHLQFDPTDPPWLASSEDGRQLYIEGGDQELDLAALKMDGDEWRKDRMVIGQFAEPERRDSRFPQRDKRKHNITYQTKKKFDDFEEVDYQHDLGEQTGVRPILEYEPRNKRLLISGGNYRIEQPLFDMSPGIEN